MNSAANVCTAWVLANAKDSACCYLQTSADATTTAYFVDADKNSCTACNAVASSVKQMLRSKQPLTIVKLVLLVKPVLVELVPLVADKKSCVDCEIGKWPDSTCATCS